MAAIRGTDTEIKRIVNYGKRIENEIKSGKAINDTIGDHRMIMEFLDQRNAEGAKNAMRIHIIHTIKELNSE